jgi:cupin superfamily acireductone dioxygenase involved in methionine salvage
MDDDLFQEIVALFEDHNTVKQKLNDYLAIISQHRFCIPERQVVKAKRKAKQADNWLALLRSNLAQTLVDIRI